MVASAVHLIRHGEVHNPEGVLYGRLEGFRLSDLGHRMAQSAADELTARGTRVTRLIASPLLRTQESARPVAAAFDLEVETEERVIEPWNAFEGRTLPRGRNIIRQPAVWRLLFNPRKPSWGEPYTQVRDRMLAVIDEAFASTDDGDAVIVTHQMPIVMVQRHLAGLRLSHDPRKRRCSLSSITSLARRGGAVVQTDYRDPAGALIAAATDTGAV